MRLFRPCFIAGFLYPDALFRIKTKEKLLYLSFDDGPDLVSTPSLLEILDKYNVKAIFFCNGREAEKHPELIYLLKSVGHIIGNHGFNHLNGWRTPLKEYLADIENASKFTSSTLFRPPYGKLRPGQFRLLRNQYKIFFWDIMPYDFDETFDPADSLNILLTKLRPGSVIVLHDQPRSSHHRYLQQFIETALKKGYRFVLPDVI